MDNPRKIDRSFKDRLSVISLLEKLSRDNITYAEMDEIGVQLKKAGRSAVQPLLRRLWKEKSGILISKYTYLLDFLDDKYWLDQIIQIALKRRDLGAEGRTAIMATLEGCGIDITIPPFSVLFAGGSAPVPELFEQMRASGEEGLLIFLDDFAFMADELKQQFLFELAAIADEGVLEPLKLLLWHDDDRVVKMAVAAIARVRFKEAANTLAMFRREAESSLHGHIDQSLRRLSFVGIVPDAPLTIRPRKPFHSAYAGPLDGNGYRHIWLTRWRDDEKLDSVDFQIHDLSGLNSVWGVSAETPAAYDERAAERFAQELIEPVSPEYALALLCDALYTSRSSGTPIPPEFLLRRSVFAPEELAPAPYIPPSKSVQLKIIPDLVAQSVQLFDDEFFAGWGLESCRVYDMAEEWLALEKRVGEGAMSQSLERLIETLCRDEIQPALKDISNRLFMNADYMARTGADSGLVNAAIAAAVSISQFSLPCHLHPFLRRFAMESMIIARESLEEGYDLRDFSEDDWE